MRGRPFVKYKGELDTQNNPQHKGWLPKHTGALKERARQRGSELKGQIEEGQIAYLELLAFRRGDHPCVCPRRPEAQGQSESGVFPGVCFPLKVVERKVGEECLNPRTQVFCL